MWRFTRGLLNEVLLAGRAGNRLLNESSVLIDVWEQLSLHGRSATQLLLTPLRSYPAASLARDMVLRLRGKDLPAPPRIAPLGGVVALTINLPLFITEVLPLATYDLADSLDRLETLVRNMPREAGEPGLSLPTVSDFVDLALTRRGMLSPDLRLALVVVLLWAALDAELKMKLADEATERVVERLEDLKKEGRAPELHDWCVDIPRLQAQLNAGAPSIWRVSLNRPVEAMAVSTQTIKADAARRLFNIDCSEITFAVIDSGIDGSHPAFRDHAVEGFSSRILKAFDFTAVRDFASYDILLDEPPSDLYVDVVSQRLSVSAHEARRRLAGMRDDAMDGRPLDWALLSQLIEVRPDQLPTDDATERPNGHGTHVAGILAGDWREGETIVHQGVCPDLKLYDLRVLGPTETDTEFAVIAALEFVRWMNDRNKFMVIHGVNLSIGLKHDVLNFACGQTPVCRAADETVGAGVVVVAAAGNWGHHDFVTKTGAFQGYASMSIADPGNAQLVITVGSTHRERPHEYGVSFFSSRGPTGDGRKKPDLVAPGERIDGPLPDLGYGRLDGTSMAAPHVAGAAALLMARHNELIKRPGRIKELLMESAVRLGREKDFEGAGLVDVLSALQKV